MAGCPHRGDRRFCPLYVASHVPGAGGCDDGELGHGNCAVDRGRIDFAARIGPLRVTHPGLVEQCEWARDMEDRRRLRARNLRANGIH